MNKRNILIVEPEIHQRFKTFCKKCCGISMNRMINIILKDWLDIQEQELMKGKKSGFEIVKDIIKDATV